MTIRRAGPLALVLVASCLGPAAAQFGGMPGMPGSPAPSGPPFGAPQQPAPLCQELITLRDKVGKRGQAIQVAGKMKAPPEQICQLFRAFTAAEARMIEALQERKATCGVPEQVITQIKGGHVKSTQIAKQVCDVAAQGPRPSSPSQGEALGTLPASWIPGLVPTERVRFYAPAPRCSELHRLRSQPVPCVD